MAIALLIIAVMAFMFGFIWLLFSYWYVWAALIGGTLAIGFGFELVEKFRKGTTK